MRTIAITWTDLPRLCYICVSQKLSNNNNNNNNKWVLFKFCDNIFSQFANYTNTIIFGYSISTSIHFFCLIPIPFKSLCIYGTADWWKLFSSFFGNIEEVKVFFKLDRANFRQSFVLLSLRVSNPV